MTVAPSFGFGPPGAAPPQRFRQPFTPGEIAADTPLSGEVLAELLIDGGWVEVSTSMLSFRCARNSERTSGVSRRYQAGSASITLLNRFREFDPLVTSIRPGIGLRISIGNGTGWVRVFTGRCTAPVVEFDEGGLWSTCTLSAVDKASTLATAKIPAVTVAVGAGERVSERIDRCLDAVGVQASGRDITPGGVTLAGTVHGVGAWEEINIAVAAEAGECWVDPDNKVRFLPLASVLDGPAEAVFDQTFSTLTPIYDDDLLANQVQYALTGGSTTVINDLASQARNTDGLPATLEDLKLPHSSQALANSWAQLQLLALAEPEFRVAEVGFDNFTANQSLTASLLALDIASRVTVKWSPPPGTDLVTRDGWVAGIEWDGRPGGESSGGTMVVSCSLALSSASRFNFIAYDSADAVLDAAGFAPIPATFTAGRYVAVAGSSVPPGDINAVVDQTFMRFATAAARSAAIPTPTKGMQTLLDDDGWQYFTGTHWLRP
jgi:hypothetical protein